MPATTSSSLPVPFASFGEMLRFLRQRVHLKQGDLAALTGYSVAQISRLEQNLRLPDVTTVAARFVPALELQQAPELVAQLIQLAAAAQRRRPYQQSDADHPGEALTTISQPATPATASLPLPATPHDEIRVMTVLCVRLSNPADMAQTSTPEEAAQQVKSLLQVIEQVLFRYQAHVAHFLGDGVVAVFGAGQLHEDDPERAIRAALAIQQATQPAGLAASAAINTGQVFWGRTGSLLAPEVSIVGPAVNLAERLQRQAPPGQILVSEATYRQTYGAFLFTPLVAKTTDRATSSGAAAAYRVVSAHWRPQKTRGFVDLRAQLIGRKHELARMKRALALARKGKGQLITLSGEAGLGKSRLVSELKKIAQREVGLEEFRPIPLTTGQTLPQPDVTVAPQARLLWLEGRCLELATSISYWPLFDMLRAYFVEPPPAIQTDAVGSLAAWITAALQAMVTRGDLSAQQMEEVGPLLGELFSVRFGNAWDDRLRNTKPEQIKHQMFMALRTLFSALARRQPLVLVFEDLHWADPLSVDLIASLLAVLSQQPILLICTYRLEQHHPSTRLALLAIHKCPGRLTELTLRELTPAQSRTLIEALLAGEKLPARVKEMILAKAQGNPLFVEEILRSLIDRQILYRVGATWEAQAAIEYIHVPENVQAVILGRVDRLSRETKMVLQAAAVIGRWFRRRVLAHTLPPELDLTEALTVLEERGFIYQERLVPEEEYSFKHVLVQEAVYGMLLRDQRQQLHRQVAESLEQIYTENSEEYDEQLAHHYDLSGAREKAVAYLLKAGEKARRAYLNEEAISYFRRALEWLPAPVDAPSLPHGLDLELWRLAALKGLGLVYLGIGKIDQAEDHFRRAIVLARQLKRTAHELARLFFQLGEVLLPKGGHEERIRLGEEGLALLGADLCSLEAALMNTTAGWSYYRLGELERGRALILRNAQFLEKLPYTEELRPCYVYLCIVYRRYEKNVEQALYWARRLETQAGQHHDVRALAGGDTATILDRSGDVHGAIEHVKRCFPLFEKIGDPKHEGASLCYLASLFRQLGDLQNTEWHAQRALKTVEAVGVLDWITYAYRHLALVYLCRQEWTLANEAIQKAIQVAQHIHDPVEEMWCIYCLARVHLAQGDRQQALVRIEEMFQHLTMPAARASLRDDVYDGARFLNLLNEACQDRASLDAYYRRMLAIDAQARVSPLVQWLLEPTTEGIQVSLPPLLQETFVDALSPDWQWHDPFGDSSLRLSNGLEIRAANARHLWQINLSAPRLLRSIQGNFSAQTVCGAVSAEQPAIGGILLWQDAQNYLRLDKGTLGAHEIGFRGCIANRDLTVGRGRLPGPRTFFRLERYGEWVHAFCSADGEQWFTVGQVAFPTTDTVQVGLHAIGEIDRWVSPGEHRAGTAIRFEGFEVYKR